MIKFFLLISTAIFFAIFGIIQGLRTKELRLVATTEEKDLNDLWHKWQGLLHGVFAFAISIHFGISVTAVISFFLTLVTIWITFDFSNNKASGKEWYYAEDKGINGAIKKRGGEITVLAVKAILFSSLLILFILL